MLGGALLDEHIERNGFAKLRIGDDDFARVDVSAVMPRSANAAAMMRLERSSP